MPFSVYMLRCADGSYYVGHTENLERRMTMHERGEIPGHTADLRPLDLVWTESFRSREEAISRERQVKGWSRRKKQALVDGRWDVLIALSRSRQPSDAGSASTG